MLVQCSIIPRSNLWDGILAVICEPECRRGGTFTERALNLDLNLNFCWNWLMTLQQNRLCTKLYIHVADLIQGSDFSFISEVSPSYMLQKADFLCKKQQDQRWLRWSSGTSLWQLPGVFLRRVSFLYQMVHLTLNHSICLEAQCQDWHCSPAQLGAPALKLEYADLKSNIYLINWSTATSLADPVKPFSNILEVSQFATPCIWPASA